MKVELKERQNRLKFPEHPSKTGWQMTDRKLTPDMHTLDHNTLDAKLYTLYSVFYK